MTGEQRIYRCMLHKVCDIRMGLPSTIGVLPRKKTRKIKCHVKGQMGKVIETEQEETPSKDNIQ